jgi:acetyl esterase/lipase
MTVETIRLWTGQPPDADPATAPEALTPPDATGDRRWLNVQHPELVLYAPPQAQTVVVICPGGGYQILSWDKEGLRVADWLAQRGLAGAVLKYRLPYPTRHPRGHLAPLTDAQQALRWLRPRYRRVGILGFSAGGHLAACAATMFDGPETRPDFCVLVYPVISTLDHAHLGSKETLLGPNPSPDRIAEFCCDRRVTAATPPTFLVHARDDAGVPVENTLRFAHACRQHGVPVTVHIYERGGHGFGLGIHGGEVADWPTRLETFLEAFR